MSRRKQSRPQHFDHNDADMPGPQIDIATNKVNTAVTSASPQIKLEWEDSDTAQRMTQSPEYEADSSGQNEPSKMDAAESAKCALSPGARGDNRDAATAPNSAESPNGDVVVIKSTKSASCGSLSVNFRREDDLANKLRRASADAVEYSVVKSEPDDAGFEANQPTVPNPRVEEPHPIPTEVSDANSRIPALAHAEEFRKASYVLTHGDIASFQHLPAMITPMKAERKYECEKCGVGFRSKKTYNVHVKHYCSGKRHDAECTICGAKFDSEKRLSIHMEDHAQYVCLVCSERMPHPEACRNHMILHAKNVTKKEGSDVIRCPGCALNFSGHADLTEHLCSHHVTTRNLMPYLYGPAHGAMQQHAPPVSPPQTERRNSPENGDVARNSPTGAGVEGVEVHHMSPPLTTSTPTRPTVTTKEAGNGAPQPFSCIVCSLGFPDVVELQRHLLTSHASGVTKAVSPVPPIGKPPPPRTNNRQNCRKFSTVSPPQLSMLSPSPVRKLSEPQRRIGMSPEARPPSSDLVGPSGHSAQLGMIAQDDTASKKRKERNSGEEQTDSSYEISNSLKRAKKDIPKQPFALQKVMDSQQRRISCPVVSNNLIDADKGAMHPACFMPSPLEERYCVQCDITFSNSANFRAHKKYYCASRHMHKTQDDFGSDRQEDENSPDSRSVAKMRKSNAGNRSSMTSRKRSHLTPLETVRGISPIRDPSKESTLKVPSVRKSCPSTSPTDDVTNRQASPQNHNPSPHTPPVITKKHLCQECNIMFSKYDTYVAHKKFYCESRRKDRGAQRLIPPKVPMKRKSESNLRDPVTMVENPLFSAEHQRMWSPQVNSPSTDGDEERAADMEDVASLVKKQQQNQALFKNGNLPFGPYAMDQEMLARMSFMHPLIINQYLTLLRERMAHGMCGNGFLVPPVPLISVTGDTATPSTGASLHKRSMSETRAPLFPRAEKTSPHPRSPALSPAPGKSNVDVPPAVKQEPADDQRDLSRETQDSRLGASPLDLSKKPTIRPDEHRKSLPVISHPTIDLRTTAIAVVKKETNLDFPIAGQALSAGAAAVQLRESERTSPDNGAADDNSNANNNKQQVRETQPPSLPAECTPHQQKLRAQHCKNCDARFTSLSTFIAHKKYYCSASGSNSIVCGDAKAVQMAH